MWKVTWGKNVRKQLDKVPKFIVDKFQAWVDQVELIGLEEVRKRKGYHDEPLKGDRKGERSIRLNNAYRAIYVTDVQGNLKIVEVIEVNKHEYKK